MEAWGQMKALLIPLPLAVLAASFLSHLIPTDHLVGILGQGSGLKGIALASLLGSLMPGGPIFAFPLAVALFDAGAGTPQLVALLTSWSTLAFHRVLVFELPLMGFGFIVRRLAASAILPIIAGITTHAVMILN